MKVKRRYWRVATEDQKKAIAHVEDQLNELVKHQDVWLSDMWKALGFEEKARYIRDNGLDKIIYPMERD